MPFPAEEAVAQSDFAPGVADRRPLSAAPTVTLSTDVEGLSFGVVVFENCVRGDGHVGH